jgi:hypothetical protein
MAQKRFDVPVNAAANGPKTLPMLDDEISRIGASGNRVYFLGILDMPEVSWKLFLENRFHLPYHSLDAIRRCAKPVEKLTCKEGGEVLWQLSLACTNLRTKSDHAKNRYYGVGISQHVQDRVRRGSATLYQCAGYWRDPD